jgi:hypothetical protein
MSEMVERAAAVVSQWMPVDVTLTGTQEKAIARAVIRAMREPTEAMTLPGAEQLPDYEPGCDHAASCWRAMIDAALRDPL